MGERGLARSLPKTLSVQVTSSQLPSVSGIEPDSSYGVFVKWYGEADHDLREAADQAAQTKKGPRFCLVGRVI